jgi:cell wall-associated NlpC family hydrolase
MPRLGTTNQPPTWCVVLIVVAGVTGLVLSIAPAMVAKMLERAGELRPVPVVFPSADPSGFHFSRLEDPARTAVTDRRGIAVATFSDGARTVVLAGPLRTIAEPQFTTASVQTSAWVRLAPQPWYEGAEQEPWVRQWLSATMTDTTPDVLAVATQYVHDAPDLTDANGVRYAGNASFGPELDKGKREIGADFYDYLGLPWHFPDGTEKKPDATHLGALDCSGFLRIVYGYREGYALLAGDTGPGLPRRANSIAKFGPGSIIIPDRGVRPADLNRLQPGDLLFFTTDADSDIDHSAIYLGRDTDGRHRFISSRGTVNGPTMGDVGGASVVDGDGFFAQRFRTARRI